MSVGKPTSVILGGQLQSSSASKSTTKTGSSDSAVPSVSRMDQTWLSGFFDRGTWQEALGAWAPGVIVGRARLGGIPCGVVTPETRVSVCRVPADPANPASEVQTINQAGQVWYPDSSYKTAQAIADFAREELPLFIFANWRGFSGGLKDMYDQVGLSVLPLNCPTTQPIRSSFWGGLFMRQSSNSSDAVGNFAIPLLSEGKFQTCTLC